MWRDAGQTESSERMDGLEIRGEICDACDFLSSSVSRGLCGCVCVWTHCVLNWTTEQRLAESRDWEKRENGRQSQKSLVALLSAPDPKSKHERISGCE